MMDTHPQIIHLQKRRSEAKQPGAVQNTTVLSQQYGGRHAGGWVSRLPESWIPYVQLMRLSPPVALALIYFPHLLGSLLAATLQGSNPRNIIWANVVLLTWSLFFSNAAHAWNDLVDAPLDAAVARTCQRPIPRGAISPRAALIFSVSQILIGLVVLHFGFAGTEEEFAVRYVVPNLFATIYYPYAKRHTHFAQLVLGVCLAWGVVIGCAALGHEPFAVQPYLSLLGNEEESTPATFRVSTPVLYLTSACVLWTAIYDTIYAHQDLPDDVKLGLRSLAVLLGEKGTKPVLSTFLCIMTVFLWLSGASSDVMRTGAYMIIAPIGSAVSLGAMITCVDLRDAQSCWSWFKYGYWGAGCCMAGGLFAEYLMGLMGFRS